MGSQVELKPGIGIGEIEFGASQDKVRLMLGPPDDEERFDNGDQRWWYSSLQSHLYFGHDNSLRMDLVETANNDARLWGYAVIGLSLTDLLRLFRDNGYVKPDEIIDEGDAEFLYRFPGCNVYVEAGLVTSIQLTVLFDDKGDNVIWPTTPTVSDDTKH